MKSLNNILLPFALATAFASPSTFAEKTPVSRGVDSRVQLVEYNPDDVVLVKAKAGIATHIVLNKDETYQNHAFGDSEAWNFAEYGNSIFVKPKMLDGNTNLIVLTDRRTYNFYLEVSNKKTFEVKFLYSDEERAKNLSRQKLNNTQAQLNEIKNRFENKKINLAYRMRGSTAVAPINVWDDGTFTYFKFGANTDLPAIYYVDANGKENLYNRTTMGVTNDIVMMHGIGSLWRLRIGESALDVANDALNKDGNKMQSGTVVNKAQREVLE